ncbi:MAG: MOSC domain-containing protein [Opitutus sp.]
MAHIAEILIAVSPQAPVVPQQQVRAVPGRGLEGDRYFDGTGTFSPHPPKPDFEVTLIQREHVEAFAAASGIRFSTHDARRNLVTVGIDLNTLVGREFQIGSAVIRGLRWCEPCNYLAKQTAPEVLRGLLHKGGLRAQVVKEGIISVNDSLVELDPSPSDSAPPAA